MRIAIISENIWPPVINTSGMKSIFELIKELSKSAEVHVFTSTCNYTRNLNKMIAKNPTIKFHIVHLKNMPQSNFRGMLSKILIWKKIVQVNKKRHFDIIHEFTSSFTLINASFIIKKLINKKTKYVISLCTIQKNWKKKLSNIIVNCTDKIIVHNTEFYRALSDKGIKSQYVPIPFKFRKKEKKKKRKKTIKIVYIGPLESRKGIHLFVKLIKYFSNNTRYIFEIITYGKGIVEPNYATHKKTVLAKLKHCHNFKLIEGYVETNKTLSNADIFVLPTTDQTGTLAQPLTLIESLNYKLIPIASDVEGIKDIIQDEKNGFIFKNNSFNDLVSKIKKANKIKIETIYDNNKKVKDSFKVENITYKLFKTYEALIK